MTSPIAIIVGGSISGLSACKSLLEQSFRVILLERRKAPKTHGAGLSLDRPTLQILHKWKINFSVCGLSIEENRIGGPHEGRGSVVFRDEEWGRKSLLWFDLYSGLLEAVEKADPTAVRFGENVVGFNILNEGGVEVYVENKKEPIVGHFLIGADGVNSLVRSKFLPNISLRYSGYIAWRGIIDITHQKFLESDCRKSYKDLANCAYFELSDNDGHTVFYEVPNKCFNWLWYRNQPPPNLKTVTAEPDKETIRAMKADAARVWPEAFSNLINATENPFINVIYDLDPLDCFTWGPVGLVGDAAHPTSPHAVRGTVMAITDAYVLGEVMGKVLQEVKWRKDHKEWHRGLEEYQGQRKKSVSANVLHARQLGQLKQSLIKPKQGKRWVDLKEERKGSLLAQREEINSAYLSKL